VDRERSWPLILGYQAQMTETFVFKIVGDWQMVPTHAYELDFVKQENEVVLRPCVAAEKETREYRVKWTDLLVFTSTNEALKFVRGQLETESK